MFTRSDSKNYDVLGFSFIGNLEFTQSPIAVQVAEPKQEF
jgi:hypothetical protein